MTPSPLAIREWCGTAKITVEPRNLGRGWVGFAFTKGVWQACAHHQRRRTAAIGCYRRGRRLFLGLGTGLGSALVTDGVVEPTELAAPAL